MSQGVSEELGAYLRMMSERHANDLHFKVGTRPTIRVQSQLLKLEREPMTEEGIRGLFFGLLSERQQELYEEHGGLDIGLTLEGAGRFRINIFRQRGMTSVAVRRVHRLIKGFEELHLPKVVKEIAETPQGLVIVSGVTGSGKSTTLAAMIEHINATQACHIVTVEDPIEYVYEDDKALINQREVGIDVPTFEEALKYVVRADPDVVLIGEMRDAESFASGLQAAETGHLVFGTLHTSTAAQTFDRIMSFFTKERHPLIRQTLGFSLRAIICQRLVPAISEEIGHVPAVEVLLNTPTVRKLILDGEERKLMEAIIMSAEEGMQDFTASLKELVDAGLVDRHVALTWAPNPEALRMALKGIRGSSAGLLS